MEEKDKDETEEGGFCWRDAGRSRGASLQLPAFAFCKRFCNGRDWRNPQNEPYYFPTIIGLLAVSGVADGC
jgi:hypothetical protein